MNKIIIMLVFGLFTSCLSAIDKIDVNFVLGKDEDSFFSSYLEKEDTVVFCKGNVEVGKPTKFEVIYYDVKKDKYTKGPVFEMNNIWGIVFIDKNTVLYPNTNKNLFRIDDISNSNSFKKNKTLKLENNDHEESFDINNNILYYVSTDINNSQSFYLLKGMNIKTGEKLFEKKLDNINYLVNIEYCNNEIFLFGENLFIYNIKKDDFREYDIKSGDGYCINSNEILFFEKERPDSSLYYCNLVSKEMINISELLKIQGNIWNINIIDKENINIFYCEEIKNKYNFYVIKNIRQFIK